MRGGFRLVGAGIAALLPATLLAAPGQAQDPDLTWPPPGAFQEGYVGLVSHPEKYGFWFDGSSFHQARGSEVGAYIDGVWVPCTSYGDPACAQATPDDFAATRIVPPCAQATDWEECIQGLVLVAPDGRVLRSRFVGLGSGTTFPPDPRRGLPTGSTTSLWSDPLSDDGATGFAVTLVGGSIRPSWWPDSGEVSAENPLRLADYSLEVIRYRKGPPGAMPTCLTLDESRSCLYEIPFEEGARVQVSYLMSDGPNQWLSGRLREADIQVEPARPGLMKTTVSALPVEVPMVASSVPAAEASPELKSEMKRWCGGTPCVFSSIPTVTALHRLLDLVRPLVGDTAQKVIPVWRLETLSGDVLPDRCEQYLKAEDSILALVTTNATAYSGMVWRIEDSLRYEVGALHYLPSGEPFKGHFELLMRGDAARCAWKLPSAAIKVTIQVISEDGEEQAATTAVSERAGWLRLSAQGFGFSQPTISMTLSSTAKKKTIVCKKGKKTKKVTGYAPRCPAGWRQVP